MVTTDASPVFLDTNVLVYSVIPESPRCLESRRLIERLEEQDCELWISRQVLREFFAVVSRPKVLATQATQAEIQAVLRSLERRYCLAEENSLVTEQLFLLLDQVSVGGRQIHDANIVATMLAFDIRRLATYNVSDFRRFGALVELLPTCEQAP
jgi:predicted nucleic acid-binding protein